MINRKDEHVELAQKFFKKDKRSDFDNLKFVYNSFAEMGLEEVDSSTSFAGLKMEQPFFINAMTGGSFNTKAVNEKLAIVSKETGIAMASGSLSAALKDLDVRDSFEIIRKINDDGLIFANLGAEHSIENAKRAVDILQANALQIHVNVVQELIMPEGDRNFSGWLKNIEKIIKEIEVPVIIKEVGFGMSRETIYELINVGAKVIDISGSGGTDFATIENYRRDAGEYNYLEGFGQSTVVSLLESQPFLKNADIIASGGVRNPLDIVKCLSLGAKGVGLSALFLNMVLENGVENTIERINSWKEEIRVIMTLLGKKTIKELQDTDIWLRGDLKEWCEVRGIDYKEFANRAITIKT
nr:type 2 isopentenyl-diphosphate Delta-isomerase [Tissierella sp.]